MVKCKCKGKLEFVEVMTMKKLTYEKQLFIGIIILFIMFICSAVFKNGIFSNIGWVIDGLLFVINPVCPKKSESVKHIHLWIRLSGIIVIVIGLITHFGV